MDTAILRRCTVKVLGLIGLLLLFGSPPVRSASLFGFTDTGQRLGEIPDGVASIAIGDMDNDNDLDLVVASHEQGTIIQLYHNDGTGAFARTNNLFPVTDNANPLWNFGIVLRDLNRDGFLDIATADAWRGVNIYLNGTPGTFTWAQAILVPAVNEVKGIDAADVDGDGDDDLVFGGHNGIPDRGDRIYLNDGMGQFLDSGQRLCFDVTWDTVFADMDNDLDFDFISVNRYREHPARIHVNDGTGDFGHSVEITTTQVDDSHDVKLADLNTDGLLDVVVANSMYVTGSTTSKVFFNAGNLNLTLADEQLGAPNCETKGLELIDMTNDGYYDAVLGNWNGHSAIYENDSTGQLTKLNNEPDTSFTTAIGAADLNQDGFVDIVAANAQDGCYHVYLNDGMGLADAVSPQPPASVVAEAGEGQVQLSWGQGFDPSGASLQFTNGNASIGCDNAARIATADLNSDGALDLLVGNGEELAEESAVYMNDGTGAFTELDQELGVYQLRDMAVGDIDADGDPDWILATQGDGVKVLKNDGTGQFSLWQALGSSHIYVRAVALGDVEGDGDLDLIYGSTGNRIYLNDGVGTFTDSGQDLHDNYITQALVMGDLDADGDLDFVQGNRILGELDASDRVFVNDGTGVFTDSGQILGSWMTMDIDLSDVESDGDLDLVAVSSVSGENRLYVNDGTGHFLNSGESLVPNPSDNQSKAAQFGDVDHDGDADLVIGDWNVGPKLYLNDGHGHFAEATLDLGSSLTNDLLLSDMDGDGDLDILEARKQATCNRIYYGNQAGTPQQGLTYNLRLGTAPGIYDVISGVSAHGLGQLGHRSSHFFRQLDPGTYYWSVQTVDACFGKSDWSDEASFSVASLRRIYLSFVHK